MNSFIIICLQLLRMEGDKSDKNVEKQEEIKEKVQEKTQEIPKNEESEEKKEEAKEQQVTVKPKVEITQVKEEQPKPKQETKPQQNNEQNQAEEGQENQQNWTDATESVADEDDLGIQYLDEDIMNQMDMDSDEEGGEHSLQSDEEKLSEAKMKQEQNLQQLQQQFVTGGQSDQTLKLAKHQKFCTSLGIGNNMVFSGGGDDRLLCFKQTEGKWQQFYNLKHSQTVSKIQVSHDKKYIVSLTENQLYCTDLLKLQSQKVEINEPTDVVCHKNGGVFATSHQYSVSIYNLKGLQLYATYNLDQPATNLIFSDNGKQVITACQSKLRIITPKTGEITKVAGNQFHKEQIASIGTTAQVAVTGCIAGEVYVTNLTKGNILGRLDPFKGSINSIFVTQNHALIAPQGQGVYWTDINKFKTIFHSPSEVSASAIVRVHSPYNYAISDIEGNIHLLDYRAPMKIIAKLRAGNSIHALEAKGSNLFAACQDGQVRMFDVAKVL